MNDFDLPMLFEIESYLVAESIVVAYNESPDANAQQGCKESNGNHRRQHDELIALIANHPAVERHDDEQRASERDE